MDVADDATGKWSFHALILASGQSAVETASRAELLASLSGNTQLTTPSKSGTTYRVVTRKEVEDTARELRVETVRAEREAARAAETAALADASGTEQPPISATAPLDEEIDVREISLTPIAMALAFQRLLALDKRACLESLGANQHQDAATAESWSSGSARVFLLTDYPSSLAEVHAMVLTGEAGQTTPHQSSPGVPLLPLVDGVLLVVDPMRELRERRKSISQADERRKSVTRRISVDGAADATLVDKQLPLSASSMFQTANPFVKQVYETANVSGLEWSDFLFVDLACSSSVSEVKPPAEMVRDLETAVRPLVAHKAAFKEWVSSVTTVALPSYDTTSQAAVCAVRRYEDLLAPVFEPSVSVAAVVFAMREAVVAGEDGGDAGVLTQHDGDNNASVPEAFLDYGDSAGLRLALSYDLSTKQADWAARRACDPCYVSHQRIDTVEKAIWTASDLPGVGNAGRKALPVRPRLSDAERSVLDTEYASFATIPVPRVHLSRHLLRLEDLLGHQWRHKLRLREVVEHLHAEVLPQRLAAVFRDGPTIIKEYDEPTDSLLVAAITATAPGRFRTTSWTARDQVRHRPARKDWQREVPVADEYLTPRTALAATACVPLSAGELGAVSEKCSIVYPADQSIVRLFQTAHAPAWLSVSLDGDVFGLRPQPFVDASATRRFAMQFYAHLEDGSQLSIREGRGRPRKPDGHACITATHTFADGLVVTTCSDGTIVQRRHRVVDEPSSAEETHRVIAGKGDVVCVLADASRRILLPNGDVASSIEQTVVGDDSETRELVVDPETNALVEKRPATGVVVVTHTDGSRVTYHADGTTIYATPSRSHVLITKRGLADVCIDVDVNLAAQRHSNGERVAVTKGGLRTRSVVRASDGTEIHVQYNTKVVAEVNGRLVVRKPDGTNVVAKDSGRVEVTTRRSAMARPPRAEDSDDADRDVLSHNGIYYFNCRDGNLSLVDHEQNEFRVDLGDGRGLPIVSVDLAGVLGESDADKYDVEPIPAKAVINDPIEPHLFVLHGDGTGTEILRPRDVDDFLTRTKQAAANLSEIGDGESPPRLTSSLTREWWGETSRWRVERLFLHAVRPDPHFAEVARRNWFQDDHVTACFDRLKTPVATAFCLLDEASLPALTIPDNQFTVVRRLEQLRPMGEDDVKEMLATLDKWREWQTIREASKDRFKVEDPRSADALAQEAMMQRKVVAACKATRARKKAERQRQRELQRKARTENGGSTGAPHMETVQEGDEPQDGGHADDDGDDFDHLLSEGTDEDSHSDVDMEMDDPDELMWTAFSEADAGGSGRLALPQARQALVQVLGVGVTSAELASQLFAFRQNEPFGISFDVFVDLVEAFRNSAGLLSPSPGGSIGGGDSSRNNQYAAEASPSHAKQQQPPLPHAVVAAGSAAEAVRSFSLLRLNAPPSL